VTLVKSISCIVKDVIDPTLKGLPMDADLAQLKY